VSNNSSEGKVSGSRRTISFIIQAVRGIVRDQDARRKTMFALVVVALALLFSGTTFLQTILDPREHPVWFILFWIGCGWLTLTALLLAIFDLLIVRREARKVERSLREKLAQGVTRDSPRSTSDE
jgi:hypothetical protein